jgi:predicted metal-dependent hydrolase
VRRTYKDITYTLTRSTCKSAGISIERDGQVVVRVPETLSDPQIDAVIERKRRWIYRHLAQWRDLNATRVRREYVNGEGFLYLGRSYRLRLVEVQAAPLLLKDGYFCLRSDYRDAPHANAAFRTFYRQKGLQRIGERVRTYQTKLGVQPKTVRVLELKYRWASCTPQGTLNFHWKCMMAPLTVLDYIVVHELAHLLHPNHTAAFWNDLDKMLPDYRERKAWLRVHGAGMDL